jgi:hypothetical protein
MYNVLCIMYDITNIGVHLIIVNIEIVIEFDLKHCKRIHKNLTTHI